MSPKKVKQVKIELANIVNKHSLENGSNTPDWVLPDYLFECLLAFNRTTNIREKWYGRTPRLLGDCTGPNVPTNPVPSKVRKSR